MTTTDNKTITHIPGTFLIDANASFLNGAGISKKREYQNTTLLKTFQDGAVQDGAFHLYTVPYISAQAFRRYWRDTVNKDAGWKASLMRPLAVNKDGNTNKVGGEFNPIEFPEDDIFGYMRTRAKNGDGDEADKPESKEEKEILLTEESTEQKKKGEALKDIKRTSPLATSILMSLRKDGWEGIDEGWVHVLGGTPNPYNTQFMNTTLQGIFCLNYRRLCRFENVGDNIELREDLVERFLKERKIQEIGQREYYSVRTEQVDDKKKDKSGKPLKKTIYHKSTKYGTIYEMVNASIERENRASKLLNALARLEGGAKQAAFATDISPKVLILAGFYNCANPIFNNLFEDERSGKNRGRTVILNVDALNEVVSDYKDRLCTPVFIGIRTGYLEKKNELEVKKLDKTGDSQNKLEVKKSARPGEFVVTTPIYVAQLMAESLASRASTATQN